MPDDFVLDQAGIDGLTVAACVQPADSRPRPPQDKEAMLSQLERDGMVESIIAPARRIAAFRGKLSTSTLMTIVSLTLVFCV